MVSFCIGDEVVDISLILRGVVCDIGTSQLEVDFVMSPRDAARFNHIITKRTIFTGVYTVQGTIIYFNKRCIKSSIQTLLTLTALNNMVEKVNRIQKVLNTKQSNVRNNP